jgi:hypothetical protein
VDELSHAHAYAWHVGQRMQPSPAPAGAAPMAGEGACFLVLNAGDATVADASPYAVIRETIVGRRGSTPVTTPAGDWFFGDNCTITGMQMESEFRLSPDVRHACYAHVYGDLAIDSAFDTAIAALSLKNKRIYPDGSAIHPLMPLSTGSSIVCLKQGAGNTYGWTMLDKRGLSS